MTPAEKVAKKIRSQRGPRNNVRPDGPLRCRVREVREAVGISMNVAAEAIGFSLAGMSQLERGGDCVMTTAHKIAAFYGKTVDELWPPPRRRGKAGE